MNYCTLQKERSRTILPLDKCQYFRPDCEDIVFVVVTFVRLHIQAISLYCSSHCKTLIQRSDRRIGVCVDATKKCSYWALLGAE